MDPCCCSDLEFSGFVEPVLKTNSQQAKTEKAAKTSASDGQVEVSLKEGNTSSPPVLNDSEDLLFGPSIDLRMLAKRSINVSDSNITIYDADNSKVKLQSGIYDETEAFNCSKSDQLAKDSELYRFPSRKRQKIRSNYERKPKALIKSKPLKFAVDSSRHRTRWKLLPFLQMNTSIKFFSGQQKGQKDERFLFGN